MADDHRSLLLRSSRHFSTSPGFEARYGDAAALVSAAHRLGVVAALRSAKAEKVTGVVIASCGVRIVDPDGCAVIGEWRSLADSAVNVADPEEFVTLIEEFAKKENISFGGGQPAEVLLGRDTRPDGESLLEASKEGISSVVGAIFHDMGILTTPQLHWLVRVRNKGMKASEHDYFQQLSSSYRCLVDCIPEGVTGDKTGERLVVDGANGIGGDKIEALKELCDGLEIEIRNTSKSGAVLNQGVGVDFIREQKIVPSGFGSNDIGFRCASLDGDADRLMYFILLPNHKEIEIIDGDKVLFLFTLFINEQLSILEEVESEREEGHYHARLGVLQSAYENEASVKYLRSLGVDIVSFPSGIRSLHAEASKFDIGIYFEADGHGSILFSDSYLSWLEAKNDVLLSSSKGSRRQLSVSRLLAVSRLINPTVPDALAGLLLVEAILQHNGWSLQKWKEIYSELVSRQLNTVEVEEKIIPATEAPEIVADSLSETGTKEEAETLIDEERSENVNDDSHVSEESKHIDTGTTGSAVQPVVDCEAHSVEQADIDASAESGENQEQGTTYVIAHENETLAELPEEVQQDHLISLHSDENADKNKLEASVEEEKSQDSSINSERTVSLGSNKGISGDTCPDELLEDAEDPVHVIVKEKIETKRGESDDDAWVLVSDEKGVTLIADPVISETRDCKHLPEVDEPCNEKENCSSPKVNGMLAPIENEDALIVSSDTDKVEEAEAISGNESSCDAEHQTSSGDTENPELSSSPKINGIHAPVENVEDLLVSADTGKAEEVRALSGTDSACSAQLQPQPSSVDTVELEPSNEKESFSSPKFNGTLAASCENVDGLIVSAVTDKAEEAEAELVVSTDTGKAEEAISETESASDAQPLAQMSSGETDNSQPSNDIEISSSPKANGIPVENGNDLLVSADTDEAEEAGSISAIESTCDAQPEPQISSNDTDEPHPSSEKELCLSPKVNGTLAPTKSVDDLLVSADTVKTEEVGVVSGTAIAQSGKVDVGSGSNCLVNGNSLNDFRVNSCSETINSEEAPSLTIAPQVNGVVVTLPPFEPVAKVEAGVENSEVDVSNVSNYLVDGENSDTRIHFSSSEVNVESPFEISSSEVNVESPFEISSSEVNLEAPVETLENLPIPSDVGETEVGASNDVEAQVETLENLPIPSDVEAQVETLENLPIPSDVGETEEVGASNDVEAQVETLENLPIPSDVGETEEVGASNDVAGISPPADVGAGVENGIDVNPDDVVQAERGVADCAGTAKHDPEVNGGISGCPSVQMADLEDKSENDLAEVETESESTIDKAEGVPCPLVYSTAEIEGTETTTVSDGSAVTAKHDSEVNGVEIGEPGNMSENDPAEAESKSEGTVDSVEGVCSPRINRSAETEVTNEFESVPDIQHPSQINGSSIALDTSENHRELETQAETLDVQEAETIIVSDGTVPQFKENNHDAQETYVESKAENIPVKGAKRKDYYARGVNVNTNIRFGSFDFVGNMCPKPEASSTGSRDVDHNGSASSNLGKAKGNIRVEDTFDEINSQQGVSENHCEHTTEDYPREDHAMSTLANTEADINGGNTLKGLVPAVGSSVDGESTSSLEGSTTSATAVCDGESVGDEPIKKPFYYLIRTPKYDDEKLSEQIRSAEIQLDEKTRIRDAVLAEYRQKKVTCQTLKADHQATILEERAAARDLVRLKRKEMESAQSLVNIAKDAMTIGDLDNKIANMEHTIQHETVPLNEEKKLIREIKQSKQLREQLVATTKMQGAQQALDQKNENEDRIKALRKEMDALRRSLSEADHAFEASVKRLNSEHEMLNELHKQYASSNNFRQDAYSNLKTLKSQWSAKNKQFWSYKDAQRQANSYAASGDRASLQSLCVNQVESTMKLWNQDDEFRRDYIRCNLRSTLRRLGTPDGRSLGPEEESQSLAMAPARRIISSVKDRQVIRATAAHPEPVVDSRKADTKSANKAVQQLKPNATTKKPTKASPLKIEEAQASKIEEEKENLEILKAKKEEEELARKAEESSKKEQELARIAEELRKEEEAARLKEARRLEERAKFQEAQERKRKQAEKAQAKAELKARREAEEKEKEKEKRAKRKENKRGTAEDAASNPDSEAAATAPDGPSEPTKEAEPRDRSVTVIKRAQKPQYTKQTKLKTMLPPPPPLRNRGKRRMRQWMWVAVTVMAVLGLFFLGNLNLREITGAFSSWH